MGRSELECPQKRQLEKVSLRSWKLESCGPARGGRASAQMGMAAEDWQGRGMEQAASLAYLRNPEGGAAG